MTPKRDFSLDSDDESFLDTCQNEWATIIDDSGHWLVIYDFILPSGYQQETANVALSIVGDYLISGIDMFYFYPPLQLKNSKIIAATDVKQVIDGFEYQRWSRHKLWRPGVDSIETHLCAMNNCLTNETTK